MLKLWYLAVNLQIPLQEAQHYLSSQSCLCAYSMKDPPSGQLQGTLNGIQLTGFVLLVNNHAVLAILIL